MKTYVVGLQNRGCDFVAPIGLFKTDGDFIFSVPCDGRELLISGHKEVAEIFENNYGCVNKFGGDGVNTFALPKIDSCDFVIRERELYSQQLKKTTDHDLIDGLMQVVKLY